MKTITASRTRLAALAVTALLSSGCSRAPEPQFAPAPATLKLMTEVREGTTVKNDEDQAVHLPGVTEFVDRRFGKLPDPTIWPLLPVDYGGDPATIAKVVAPPPAAEQADSQDKPLEQVTVTLVGPEGKPVAAPVGSQVAWQAGTYEGSSHRVASYEATTGELTLAGTFDDGLPEVGDELLVNAGTILAKGRTLYARHCLHCHGPSGAGDGPTAKYLEPKPRDYRLGLFKFTSTAQPEKASRADLTGILERGIPGTSMPAFRLLPKDDLHALVEYVRWLSIRGEYETQLARTGLAYGFSEEAIAERIADGETREEIFEGEIRDFLEYDLPDTAESTGEDLAAAWENANDESAVVTPTIPRVADTPESRARGRALYLSDKTKCATCHGPYGKGDGSQAETFQFIRGTSETYPTPGFYDDWDNPIKPRDLTQGIFRGGRRPIDIYRRIYSGIKGTPMSSFGSSLSEQEIWDIVNYVLHAPHDDVPAPGKGTPLASTSH